MRINPGARRLGDLPDDEEREAIEAEAARADSENTEFVRFLSDSDRVTPMTLFNDPPAQFVARLRHGAMVYCYLIDDYDTHLAYLCYAEDANTHSVVYVYRRNCEHQMHMIQSVYGSYVNEGPYRVVPISNRMSRGPTTREYQADWSIWIFHHYFGFPYLSEEHER